VRGFIVVERENGSFRQSGGTLIGGSGPTPPDQFIEYQSRGVSTKTAIYSYVDGRVISPEVHAVEVLFDTGEVVQDDGSDRIYGVIAVGSKGVCEVRVLGRDAHILTTTTLAVDDPGTGAPRAEIRPGGIDGWYGSQAEPTTCEPTKKSETGNFAAQSRVFFTPGHMIEDRILIVPCHYPHPWSLPLTE
jgi:hypothetical protein